MSDVRANMVQGPLRDVSIQYKNGQYIAEQVFPSIIVSPKSQLTLYNRGDYFRDEAQVRGPGSSAVRGNPGTSTVDINTQNWAFAGEATDEDRRDARFNNAPPLQPDMDAIEFATEKLLLKKEVLVSNAVVASTTTWNGETAGEDAAGGWAAGEGNTFIADVQSGINTIVSNTGVNPSMLRLVMSYNTFQEIQQESTVLSRIQYSALGIVTEDLLASLFGIDKVIVSRTVINTADEGTSDSMTSRYLFEQTANKGSAFLHFYGPSGLRKPNAGYLCTLPNGGSMRSIYKFREDARHTDVYEVSEEFAVSTSQALYLGKLWKDTILT